MTRKAILLSAPSPTSTANEDIAAWYRFLRSNAGGAWTDAEITRLSNCDRDAALAAVRAAKGADYSLIVFAGRGEIRQGDLPWPEASVVLGDGPSLSERELNSGTARCAMVFDWSNRNSADPPPVGRESDRTAANAATSSTRPWRTPKPA